MEEAGTRLAVMDARKLEDMGQRPPSLMRVRVDMGALDAGVLDELKQLFANKPGSCSVAFDLISPEGAMATLRADQRVRADQELVQEVCRLVRGKCGAAGSSRVAASGSLELRIRFHYALESQAEACATKK